MPRTLPRLCVSPVAGRILAWCSRVSPAIRDSQTAEITHTRAYRLNRLTQARRGQDGGVNEAARRSLMTTRYTAAEADGLYISITSASGSDMIALSLSLTIYLPISSLYLCAWPCVTSAATQTNIRSNKKYSLLH